MFKNREHDDIVAHLQEKVNTLPVEKLLPFLKTTVLIKMAQQKADVARARRIKLPEPERDYLFSRF